MSANLNISLDAVAVNTPTPLVGAWTACVHFRKRPVTSRWVDFEWDTAGVSVNDDRLIDRSGPDE